MENLQANVRKRRAAGESVTALARDTYLPRHLIRAWTRDIEVPRERELRRVARATAWLRSLIMSHCDSAEFTLEQTGPATFEATFSKGCRLRINRLADALGGVATLKGDTITIDGIEIELRCVGRRHPTTILKP